MTGRLILTRGIPGSGKSTWARAFVAESPTTRVRLNRDDLRVMLTGASGVLEYGTERAITEAQHALARDALSRDLDVVVDDMNLRARFVREWQKIAPVETEDFEVPVEVAVSRDAYRQSIGQPAVGERAIRGLAARFLRDGKLPALPEPVTPAATEGEPYVADWQLPAAYLFDIDGTLAHIPEGGRDVYDGSRAHEDLLDEEVADVLRILSQEHYIVVMSGRGSEHRAVTEAWLQSKGVLFDELFMRAEGDSRKDSVVKRELFDEHVRPRLNVRGVFDDRNSVVAMWRSLGLKTYQVQEGDF